MRIRRFRGLLVLALWQAPIGTDQEGRTRIGFGFGAGQLEYEALNCGEPAAYSTTKYGHIGAEVEHFASRRTRVHASAGLQRADSSSSAGPFAAFMLSFEGRHFGIGGGAALVPAVTTEAHDGDGQTVKLPTTLPVPSLYIRAGNHDKVHVRAEVFSPSVNSTAEAFRVVVGYNRFDARRPSFAIGYAGVSENASESIRPGIVAEWFQPISTRAALGLHGFTAAGVENRLAGATAQVKIVVN